MRTKIKQAKKYIKFVLLIAALIQISGCTPAADRLYDEAYAEIEKGHFRIAVDLLEKSANLEKKNLLKNKHLIEAARIARFEIQDYDRSIRIYRSIVLGAEEVDQRINSQRAISEIYLENIQSYGLALKELQVLEPLIKDEAEKEKIKFRISQAHYLTGDNQQAIEEINSSLRTSKNETLNFLKLKAQVLIAEKKYKEAIQTYNEIFTKDPVFFQDENLFIAVSVVYEENEEYKEALEYLTRHEKQIKDKAYFELRYKRLKERFANKPLFKGRRK